VTVPRPRPPWWVAAGLALAACGTLTPGAGPTTPGAPQAAVTVPAPPVPTGCHARGTPPRVLPDPTCTPGALNPAVTQATIRTTICVRGWTATIRPPLSWTEPIKRRLMRSYGYPAGTSLRTVELDHLTPLELGGAPAVVADLWPEPGASPNLKDTVESTARARVCSGRMTLVDAQTRIATDWAALGHALGVKGL